MKIALLQWKSGVLSLAELHVVVDGKVCIAKSADDLPKLVRALVVLVVFLCLGLADPFFSMHPGQEDDFSELVVDGEAGVGEPGLVVVSVAVLACFRAFVIELLVCNGLTLSGVSDAGAARVAEKLIVGELRRLGLVKAPVDAAHHPSSDHADFIQEQDGGVL